MFICRKIQSGAKRNSCCFWQNTNILQSIVVLTRCTWQNTGCKIWPLIDADCLQFVQNHIMSWFLISVCFTVLKLKTMKRKIYKQKTHLESCHICVYVCIWVVELSFVQQNFLFWKVKTIRKRAVHIKQTMKFTI